MQVPSGVSKSLPRGEEWPGSDCYHESPAEVFLESQSLAEYVADEIEIAQTESNESTAKLKRLDDVKPHDNSDENLRLLKKRRKYQQKSSTASRKLLIMKWVQAKVVPWLPHDLFDMYALILGVLLLTTVLKGLCVFVQEVLGYLVFIRKPV